MGREAHPERGVLMEKGKALTQGPRRASWRGGAQLCGLRRPHSVAHIGKGSQEGTSALLFRTQL